MHFCLILVKEKCANFSFLSFLALTGSFPHLNFQIWSLGSPDPNFTLDGHSKGVNCVDYFTGGDRPYLITGSDDQTAKV
jgi:WD40 repeat protein